MPIYTDDNYYEEKRFHGPRLVSSIGIGPKVTKAIDEATRDWLDAHPEATTTVEDESITTEKLADGAVTALKLDDDAVHSSNIRDGAVSTPKIADGAVNADKLASNAVNALPVMGPSQFGVAKLGAGLAIYDDEYLELDGGGDIATAVSSWLDAHPEATTTVQDDSITTIKIKDNQITNAKLSDAPTAAKAQTVRNNVSTQLISELLSGGVLDMTSMNYDVGYYIKSDGTIATNASMCCNSDMVEIPPNTKYVMAPSYIVAGDSGITKYSQSKTVFFYDSNNDLISANQTTIGEFKKYEVPSNATYFKANFSAYDMAKIIVTLNYDPITYQGHASASLNDLNNMTDEGTYLIAYSSTLNRPYPASGILLTIVGHENSYVAQTYMCNNGHMYYRFRNNSLVWSEWVSPTQQNGLLFSGTVTVEPSVITNIGIYGLLNKEYYILFSGERHVAMNVFSSGHATQYYNVQPFMDTIHYTPAYNGELCLYQTGSDNMTLDVMVYDAALMRKCGYSGEVFNVYKNYSKTEYTSLTELLIKLKDNTLPKTINIYGDTYDIFQEYQDCNVPIYEGSNPTSDFWDYCVFIPENTRLVGHGDVTLSWSPDPTIDDLTMNQSICVSTLNLAGSCEIDNLTLVCKNGRYCIHEDTMGRREFFGATHKISNVRCVKLANDIDAVSGNTYGKTHTIGFGADPSQKFMYTNCEFENYCSGWAFYGHVRYVLEGGNRYNWEGTLIVLDGCTLYSNSTYGTVKLGNGASGGYKVRMFAKSCFINGKVWIINESSSQSPAAPNKFDTRFLNCDPLTFQITDPDNPYPPKQINPIATETTEDA